MSSSWFFLAVTLLLVQPSQALHTQDIRNVIQDRHDTSTHEFWGRALQMAMDPRPAVAVAVILSVVFLILAAIGTRLWYVRRKANHGSMANLDENRGWWNRIRYGLSPPSDIEKGGKSFHSRFAALRSASKETYDELPPLREPGPPVLPHIPKQPGILERIGDPRASSFFSRPFSLASRVLVPPPPAAHRSITKGQQSRKPVPYPTDLPEPAFPRQNPFVPSPSRAGINVHAAVVAPITDTATLPQSLQPLPPKPLMIVKKQDPTRTERVQKLHMELMDDFTRMEELSASPQIVHPGQESVTRLRRAKTGKSLRFMLPSSPRTPLKVAPLRSASIGGRTGRATGISRPICSPLLRTASV